jgi:hypothetical protein
VSDTDTARFANRLAEDEILAELWLAGAVKRDRKKVEFAMA